MTFEEWRANRSDDRRAFDRMTEMKRLEFAKAVVSPEPFPMKLGRNHRRIKQ